MQLDRIKAGTEQASREAARIDLLDIADGRNIKVTDLFRPLQEGAVVDILDHHHADKIFMGVMVIESKFDQTPHRCDRRQTRRVQLGLAFADLPVGIFQRLQITAVLVAEIVVDHALAGLSARRDFVDTSARKAASSELAQGRVQNILARPLRILRPACLALTNTTHSTSLAKTALTN